MGVATRPEKWTSLLGKQLKLPCDGKRTATGRKSNDSCMIGDCIRRGEKIMVMVNGKQLNMKSAIERYCLHADYNLIDMLRELLAGGHWIRYIKDGVYEVRKVKKRRLKI